VGQKNESVQCGWAFLKKFFLALALEAVSVVVQVIQKMLVQSNTVSSLQRANKVAHNEEGIKEVLKRRD
jgi:hypothetical protein